MNTNELADKIENWITAGGANDREECATFLVTCSDDELLESIREDEASESVSIIPQEITDEEVAWSLACDEVRERFGVKPR